ncbi:MAG: hypothetical protein FJ088_16990, partial [Deltaproteobacteria bacterium]|nr:hypothetical protein [Deltaproteobacteria bacterium]
MIERNARFVYKYAIPISAASIILTLLSLYVVITKFSIKSDFADLLPEGQRSVIDQRMIRERVGSPEYIQVLLETVEKNGDRVVITSS